MGTTLVNFNEDLPLIGKYIADRVAAQSRIKRPISAIDGGFRLCQAGLVVIHFDTRQVHETDGAWTVALRGPMLELPHWQAAFESAYEDGASFVLLTGERLDVPPGAGDPVVAAVFGEALVSAIADALVRGAFRSLQLRDDCQLDLEECDFNWAWKDELRHVAPY